MILTGFVSILKRLFGKTPRISWTTLPDELPSLRTDLSREAARAYRKGLRPILFLNGEWCRGSAAFKHFRDHSLAGESLEGLHVIEIGDTYMNAISQLGFPNQYCVPQLYLLSGDGGYGGSYITGAAWGADTPENIARAMDKWLDGK